VATPGDQEPEPPPWRSDQHELGLGLAQIA